MNPHEALVQIDLIINSKDLTDSQKFDEVFGIAGKLAETESVSWDDPDMDYLDDVRAYRAGLSAHCESDPYDDNPTGPTLTRDPIPYPCDPDDALVVGTQEVIFCTVYWNREEAAWFCEDHEVAKPGDQFLIWGRLP